MSAEEEDVKLHASLTLAVCAAEWSASHLGHITPNFGINVACIRQTEGWVRSRTCVHLIQNRKIPHFAGYRIRFVKYISIRTRAQDLFVK